MARENIAHFEDVDEETGSVIQGTGKYARSVAPGSPSKTKANSKSRREKTMRRPTASPQHALTDSDDTIHPVVSDKRERERERERERRAEEREAAAAAADKEARREEKRQLKKEQERAARHAERERERERELRERAAPKKSAVRPSAKHVKTAPVVHTQQSEQYRRPRFDDDDASQYGIQPASGSRPRAMSTRPSSYYGPGSRPPTSNKQWHSAQAASPFAPAPHPSPFAPSPHAPPLASQHAPSPFTPGPMPAPMPVPMHEQSPFSPGTSYPPPAWGPGSVPYPMQPPPPQTPTDYFPPDLMASSPRHSNLARRFQQQRPSSAMGHRSMSLSSFDYEDYGPTYEQENIVRRQSLKIRDVEDRKLMPPPPPRSRTAVPPRQAIRPPPPQRQIASHGYESDDFDGDESIYQEIVPRGYEYDDGVVSRPRSHRRGSSTYSREGYQIEPIPASRSSRRHSYMAGESSSMSQSKYDSAAAAALAYQNGVSGAAEPLTAAALSKAEKKSKSSRSSGSSGSRDESEFRRSATTRTTRSSTGDGEDITIKVTGQAVLRVGNAEIQCQDGGEINISQPGRLGGSDRASTIYSDDRRSRMERLPIRARSPSQSDSYSRSQYDGYECPRIPFT